MTDLSGITQGAPPRGAGKRAEPTQLGQRGEREQRFEREGHRRVAVGPLPVAPNLQIAVIAAPPRDRPKRGQPRFPPLIDSGGGIAAHLRGDHVGRQRRDTAGAVDRSRAPPGSWHNDSNLLLGPDAHARTSEAIGSVQPCRQLRSLLFNEARCWSGISPSA